MYARPRGLEEMLALLPVEKWRILAGGTDFYPGLRDEPIREPLLDITAIEELRGITSDVEGYRIGALTSWSDIIAADLPPAFSALKLAAREVGSIQIQNRATIAGNLCNASPAADGVPPLLILDAEVELTSSSASRCLGLGDFITGNRVTERRHDEMVTAIKIPASSTTGTSFFRKLGARKYLVISIAMIAARMAIDENGKIAEAAFAIGSCSLVAQRLTKLEQDLIGHSVDDALAQIIDASHFNGLAPIDDIRASAGYRKTAAIELTREAISACRGNRPAT